MRILVCDDDTVLLDLFSRFFRQEYEAEVNVVTDGSQALSQLDPFDPDLVILDYMMPKMDGLKVLSQIRERRGRGGRPKVLVYSAFNVDREARAGGADGFLQKPGSIDRIKQAIDQIMGIE